MKNKFLPFLLAITGIIFFSSIVLFKQQFPSKNNVTNYSLSPSPVPQQTRVVISAAEENFYLEYKAKDKKVYSPFSILKEALEQNNIPLEIKNYDFGVFVKSINALESSNEKAWIYFVNGESGQVAADKMDLKEGDLVEWRYITPSE